MKSKRKQKKWLIVGVLIPIFAMASHGQDVLVFKTGREVHCDIQNFDHGIFHVLYEGQQRVVPVENVERITFQVVQSQDDGNARARNQVVSEANSDVIQSAGSSKLSKDIVLAAKGFKDDVKFPDEEDNDYVKSTGMKCVTVDIQVNNLSNSSIFMDSYTFQIRDNEGMVCDTTEWGTFFSKLEWTEITPKDKRKWRIWFMVPAEFQMRNSWVRYWAKPDRNHPEAKEMYSEWFPLRP